MIVGWDFDEVQDATARDFITTYYGTDFSPMSSLQLLMGLPGFIEN